MPSTKKLLQAAAGSAGGDNLYVEDVFSTNVYTGNGSTQTITNGIDLAGEGGLVWTKRRSGALNHFLVTTDIATNQYLSTDLTSASGTTTTLLTPASDGFAFSSNTLVNGNTASQVAWTFRKAEKFFDVVTYTGTGSNQTISHNLDSVPGCIIVRALSGDNWYVWHSSLPTGSLDSATGQKRLILNSTAAEESRNGINTITSSSFDVLGSDGETGGNGTSYVAYVFANDAGGFGDDDENIIKCGSWNENSTNNVAVDCGFEPDFVMFKCAGAASSWYMADSMRTVPTPNSGTTTGNYIDTILQANSSAAEGSANAISLTSTGFIWYADGRLTNTAKWIYIAIRRPMKTPEAGTEVFSPYAYQDTTLTTGSGTASNRVILNGGVNGGTNFPVDLFMGVNRTGNHPYALYFFDRLRGQGESIITNLANKEPAGDGASNGGFDFQEGVDVEQAGSFYYNTTAAGNRTHIAYFLKRATGFMDAVAYTGNGGTSTQAHNLGVVPELMIFKRRNSSGAWNTYVASSVLASAGPTKFLEVSDSASIATDNNFINGAPTSSLINTGSNTNQNGDTYIAYLFATLDGVSKLGSYTGTGSVLNVDCGFSAGARFILIKRTDAIGDWYYWDSARGIVAGNDPYQLLNSSAAEVTNTDYVDPLNAGFTVTSSASSTVNVSSGTFIFLAIA